MKDFLDSLTILDKYDNWVKIYAVSWVLVSAVGIGILILARHEVDAKPFVYQWKMTADDRIDAILAPLNQLERKGKDNITPYELADALRPLCSGRAFRDLREGNWDRFLFNVCKTRIIFDHYTPYFKSESTRREIAKAVKIMIDLQQSASALYGTQFSIEGHISSYINNANEFISKLPNQVMSPGQDLFDKRVRGIININNILSKQSLAEEWSSN